MKRATGARSAATGLALAASAVAGLSVFVISGGGLLLAAGRPILTPMEKILLGVITAFCVLLASAASMRALILRWRSAWAIDRLARGLRVAVLTLLSMAGLLAIGWRGYRLVEPLVALQWLPVIDVGLVALPTVVSAMVFVLAIRKAKSHS